MGGKRIKGLKARVECECCISKRGLHRPDSAVEVYQLKESKEEVTLLVGVESQKKQSRSREGSSRSEICLEF